MSRRRQRTIAVVTGTRAEYGILRTVLRAINAHPKLRLKLVVTGMHLLPRFGNTVRQIRRDGWEVAATVRMQTESDNASQQAIGLGKGIAGLARAFQRIDPQLVLMLGDRIEAFAAASAGVTCRRLVGHIHGGDVATGDVDDCLRHAITKLAHLHFPATKEAARRLKRLGEDPWRIHCVGAPGLDEAREILDQGREHDFDPLAYAPQEEYAVVVRHPCSRNAARERRLTEQALRAVRAEGLGAVALYPNTDPGYTGIIQAIKQAPAHSGMRTYPSLPRQVYLRLLRRAKVLVGNSSSGVIESAFLGTPSVNIGPRQDGRLRPASCIIDAAENRAAIRQALRRALALRPRAGAWSVYGDGHAGQRIAQALADLNLDPRLGYKKITY